MWAVLLRITKATLRMVYIYGKLFGVFLFSNDAFLYISFFSFSFVLVPHVKFWVMCVPSKHLIKGRVRYANVNFIFM